MLTTSEALIDRIRIAGDQDAWNRFVNLYLPLIYSWNIKAGLQPADASDVCQEIFIWISQHIHEFERIQTGSFRSWIRSVASNKIRTHQKKKRPMSLDSRELEQNDQLFYEVEAWANDHDGDVLNRALDLLSREFTPKTFGIFKSVFCDQKSVDEVAKLYQTSKANVYVAQSRVKTRLKSIIKGFVPMNFD